MSSLSFRRLSAFSALTALWMALFLVVASPASAHDDDDDPPITTTTTLPPPIITTTLPPVTTTILPATTTTRPKPPPTTTTTLPPTTTTTAPIPNDLFRESDDQHVLMPTVTEPPGPSESKETFVVSTGRVAESTDDRDSRGSGDGHISPREGLTVAFRAAVETFESQGLQALLLGMLITGLTVAGVDRSVSLKTLADPFDPSLS
ncbi:hypothetical protein BH18ACT5_BH18ACT5_12550 [soil metagenome]